jgi:hypothetical protein
MQKQWAIGAVAVIIIGVVVALGFFKVPIPNQNVSDWRKDSQQEPPERVSVVGYFECLPHKDRSGLQTMECAFGVAIDQSDGHYAINTALMSTYPIDYPTGAKVRVTGNLVPPEPTSKYDTDGTIWATTIERL